MQGSDTETTGLTQCAMHAGESPSLYEGENGVNRLATKD